MCHFGRQHRRTLPHAFVYQLLPLKVALFLPEPSSVISASQHLHPKPQHPSKHSPVLHVVYGRQSDLLVPSVEILG
jgi:hypothetical protein